MDMRIFVGGWCCVIRLQAQNGSVLAITSFLHDQIIRGDAFFGSDNALADNPATYDLVKAYAADNELWYQKFSAAFFKLTWLGVNASVPQLGL